MYECVRQIHIKTKASDPSSDFAQSMKIFQSHDNVTETDSALRTCGDRGDEHLLFMKSDEPGL
jgi:hypothetical protein